MPVKGEQINAYLFSDTTKINKNKKWKEDESIARSVPELQGFSYLKHIEIHEFSAVLRLFLMNISSDWFKLKISLYH